MKNWFKVINASQRSRVKSSISNYLSASNVTISPLKKRSDLYVFIYLKRLGDQQNTHQHNFKILLLCKKTPYILALNFHIFNTIL